MPAPDTYWYNLKKMHVVFAVSAVGLFVVTLWMLWADHDHTWRDYQDSFESIEDVRLTDQIEADQTERYHNRVSDLEERLAKAREEYDRRKEAYTKQNEGVSLDQQIGNKALEVDKKARKVREQRAYRDKARADYDLAIRDNRTEAAKRLEEHFEDQQAQVLQLEAELQTLESELDDLKQKRQQQMAKVDALQAELKAARADVVRLETTRNKIDPENWFSSAKRKFMQWPIIDGFNSPRKIDQIWLPDLKITLGMASTARFDRCKTCHQGIDRVEAGNIPSFPLGEEMVSTSDASEKQVKKWVAENKYPHPYATHPNPDLYLSSTSPHPTQNFGCTICHDGQGSGTSFGNASHTPNTPFEEEHWAEKYHYHSNHFWEYPMLPERFRESSCLRCHHTVTELETSPKFGNSAPKVVKGWHTIQTYGCFGCHEIHGSEGAKSLGPDLRLEPNYYGVAQHVAAAAKRKLTDAGNNSKSDEPNAIQDRLNEIIRLAGDVADAPENTEHERKTLQQMILADKGLENPLFSARIHILADNLKDTENPGLYRKVGPSLRYVKKKTTRGWLEYWTEMPKRFRPSTRMPQFFHNTNQEDATAKAFQPVQIAAIAHYLMDKSQPLDLDSLPKDYQPNAERGKDFFSKKGCLACHSHKDFPEIHQDFGPNLDKVYAKLKPGEEGFRWLYSWIRDPHRYHKRTKMPHLFLEPYTPEGKKELIDPAADIAAYLLQEREKEQPEYKPYDVAGASFQKQNVLDGLVAMNLSQSLSESQMKKFGETRIYPAKPKDIKGDEIELAYQGEGRPSDERWQAMKLNYVGRRTISQYGCYGCHDIPGFEGAKPIGVALQDWGRKDTSRLAFEHITEFLHHHNTPGTDTTLVEQVDDAMKRAKAGEFKSAEEEQEELSKAFYYDSILHHGRPGFLWQKLRQPRSYDYKKTETKRYDERLRMPKFPFDNQQIEAIATFVLGLTAEPPADKYVFHPQGATKARYEGEFLLHKYNCTGCHMVELPEIVQSIARKEEDKPSTYSDYVGMTREQIIEWFVKNREEVLDGSLTSYPSDIQQVETLSQKFGLGVDIKGMAQLANVTQTASGQKPTAADKQAIDKKVEDNIREWFTNHPELLLSSLPAADELPSGILKLLKLKPPHSGETNQKTETGNAIIRYHGLLSGPPDLESPPEEQYHGYQLWETLDVGGRVFLPGKNMSFTTPQLVSVSKGRGGVFTDWLVNRLWMELRKNPQDIAAIPKARQSSPPPLYLEGLKVQTPWLFNFLKNPDRIRHEAVLRMPRFNMSDGEAQMLANYFSAVDDSDYPYQPIPQREPAYISKMNEFYHKKYSQDADEQENYLDRSWQMLGKNPLCVTCHSVMGREFKAPDPTQVTHGPDLDTRVPSRLRPDWLEVWLNTPRWILPYTGMPAPHTKPQKGYFGDDPEQQTTALRDALINYNRLIQKDGVIEAPPPEAATPAGAPAEMK